MRVEKGKVRAPEIGRVWLNSTPLSFRQLRGPSLPILEKVAQRLVASGKGVTQKQFAGGGRCARSGIEKYNLRLALCKRTINKRQIPNERGKKAKSKAGFHNHQEARNTRTRNHVAQAECEKRGAAKV